MKYAENYLFTGKNVQWSVFYLKNAFPEFYQDKMTTETNVKISLVDLSKKADSMEYKLKKANAIKWEVASKLETKIENEWIALERKMKDAEPKFEEIEEDVSN